MEEAKEVIKKVAKNILNHFKRVAFFVIILLALIIVLLSSAVYFITVDDGTYKEDDWSSTPYAAGQYINGVSINDEGELEIETTAQDLWDKMLEEHGRVDEYLDSPEELARMMKAEIVTQYPDTRPNPDEVINWDELIENPDKMQGIIKFKRADTSGNKSNLTYVDPETFQGYIDEYNNSGSETAKNNALKHFTLKQSSFMNSGNMPSGLGTGNMTFEEGDGYTEEYTSSAGITYKHYKQFQGSYADNPYWDGTIHTDGCGPTSVAILASGLTNLNYNPGVIAAEMNAAFGYTSSSTLQQEMNSLGMSAQVISNPSASIIQDNLRNGKVMLVSVNSNTIFTGGSHIMALVDMDNNGKVYVCNPGSSTKYGWYDINEIMKGCNYIVVTDANIGAVGGTREPTEVVGGTTGETGTVGKLGYMAVVATWRQVDTTVTTSGDPNVQNSSETNYAMTTTNINYEAMVKPYTMPFDMLWALLVVGEDKNFIFELIDDLIYDSDIQITVHDNLTVTTQVDEWHYTEQIKAVVDATITATCSGQIATSSITNDVHDPDKENPYTTTKTVVTQTNTIQTELTKADVWIVDYTNEYTYQAPEETRSNTIVRKDNEEYPNEPNSEGDSYSCEHIETLRQQLGATVRATAEAANASNDDEDSETEIDYQVSFDENITAKYYNRYINIYDNIATTMNTQKYVKGVADIKEKTDKDSDKPNFVTIFNKREYRLNKSRIKDAVEWLFEIIETNQSTVNMLDLIKYLLYKATGVKGYGVLEYNFNEFNLSNMSTATIGGGANYADLNLTDDDLQILYKITSAERGGGTQQQQEYVVSVILNRVLSSKFPNTVRDVVFAPMQFQPTRNGAYDKAIPSQTTIEAVNNVVSTGDKAQCAVYFMTPAASLSQRWLINCIFLFNDTDNSLKDTNTGGTHNFYTTQEVQNELQQY